MAAVPRFALVVSIALSAAPAHAHLDLLYPPSRYGMKVLKDGPCGRSNGARSANVTELLPGATIDVTWDEYVNHPGHFRIAFDEDGDDAFENPVCVSGCTGRSPVFDFAKEPYIVADEIPDLPNGGTGHARIVLPDVECDNCTLQVIQVMYDKPPYVVPGNDIYYQCADLVLSKTASAGGAPSRPAGGGAPGGGAPGGGAPGGGAPGGGAGGSPSASGGAPSSEAGTPDEESSSSDEGGCVVSGDGARVGSRSAAPMALAFAAPYLARVARRRRRARRDATEP